jgi:hypothetical protein
MAKKKKSTKPQQQPIALNPKKYIIEAGRKVPLDKVLSDYGTHDNGIYQFFVIRKKLNGNYLVGIYLVDTHCLGLKSTTYRESLTQLELDELLKDIMRDSGTPIQEIDPNLAFNVIYGAIEYAEDLGIEVIDKDFAITEYILPDVETLEFVEVEFGHNGKPLYSQGPYDNVPKILAALNKSVGKGNYDYIQMFDSSGMLHLDNFGFNDDDDDDGDFDVEHSQMIGFTFDFKDKKTDLEKDKYLNDLFLELEPDVNVSKSEIEIDFVADDYDDDVTTVLNYVIDNYAEKATHTNLYLTVEEGDLVLSEYKANWSKLFFTVNTKEEISIGVPLQYDTFMEHFPTLKDFRPLQELIQGSVMREYLDDLLVYLSNNPLKGNYKIEPYIAYGNGEHFGDSNDHISIGITISEA